MASGLLYILCGYPFSGKTTLAREWVKRFGFSHIELDIINTERGLTRTILTEKEWQKTYKISYQRLEDLLKTGKTVLYDATNFTRKQRDILRSIAKKYQVETKVIYVNPPFNVVKKRWLENREYEQRKDVSSEDFAEVVNNFQVPTEEEGVLVFSHPHSLD